MENSVKLEIRRKIGELRNAYNQDPYVLLSTVEYIIDLLRPYGNETIGVVKSLEHTAYGVGKEIPIAEAYWEEASKPRARKVRMKEYNDAVTKVIARVELDLINYL